MLSSAFIPITLQRARQQGRGLQELRGQVACSPKVSKLAGGRIFSPGRPAALFHPGWHICEPWTRPQAAFPVGQHMLTANQQRQVPFLKD